MQHLRLVATALAAAAPLCQSLAPRPSTVDRSQCSGLLRASPAPMLESLDRRSAIGLACLTPGLMMPAPAFAESTKIKYFPGAKSSGEVESSVYNALAARGYNKDNTLFGMSVCSDEVNFSDQELIMMMRKRWGESFSLGGLAGMPFAGKAGLGAYAHHVPDDGKLFILFAPHVGVGEDAKVGALERDGIAETSSACGAAVGAYKALSKPGAAPPSALDDLLDLQFDWIKYKLAARLDGVQRSQDALAFVTYQMYYMAAEAMLQEIKAVPGIWDDCSELAVLGGVQINRFSGGDAFQPLMFQTTTKAGKTKDLYPATFGSLPDLGAVLGSELGAETLLRQSL